MTKFYIKKKVKIKKNLFEKIISSNFFIQKLYYYFKYFFFSKKILIDFRLNNKDNNLVIGAVYGMKHHQIEIFIYSLRKFYSGDIILIGIKKDKFNFDKILNKYRCKFIIDNNNPLNGFINRYKIYKKILDKFKFKKNILLSDTRDVYFQNNPFKKLNKNTIYIGAEKNIFYKDKINSNWVKKFYDLKTFYKLKNKQILCSGVIIGKSNILKNFINLLLNEHLKVLIKFRFTSLSFPRGSDNTTVNYCYYFLSKKKNFTITNSISKKISTLATHNRDEIKIYKNYFVTSKNEIISIVHQYDRYFKISKKK